MRREVCPKWARWDLDLETNIAKTLAETLPYLKDSFAAASLVSGLTMFQVILLTLMGANNGAREIAKERDVLEKELRVGLSPWAYVMTKSLLVLFLSLAQAFWMTWFVKSVCGFPRLVFRPVCHPLRDHGGHEHDLPDDLLLLEVAGAGLAPLHLPGRPAIAAVGSGPGPARK